MSSLVPFTVTGDNGEVDLWINANHVITIEPVKDADGSLIFVRTSNPYPTSFKVEMTPDMAAAKIRQWQGELTA